MSDLTVSKKHYLCGGECAGVFDQPGVCPESDCSLYGQPLLECACGDKTIHTGEAESPTAETEASEDAAEEKS